jgi:RHS repeat-associated protein
VQVYQKVCPFHAEPEHNNAFGEIVSETGEWPASVPFAYQSSWLHLCAMPDGSPLYLAPTRAYHAGLGRFLQRDFVRVSINRYIAFTNCPPKQVDPMGLQDVDPPFGISPDYLPPIVTHAFGMAAGLVSAAAEQVRDLLAPKRPLTQLESKMANVA